MAYNMRKLNKVFAFFSVIFLMSVVWVFLDDYIRPWKAVQIEALKIKKEKIAAQISAEKAKLDLAALEELNSELAAAKKIVVGREGKLQELTDELSIIQRDIKDETIRKGRVNSEVSALTFNWENAQAHHKLTAPKLFQELQIQKKNFAISSEKMKALEIKEKSVISKIDGLGIEVAKAEKGIKALTGKIAALSSVSEKLKIDPIFALRNAPFLDFLDPTLKIKQVVLDNITDDRYFRHVPKVDRCITCHTFIGEPGYEDQKNPHKTHPRLDLMVDAKSNHPMKSFGCTSCHGGEGQRVTDFNAAAHTPQNEAQRMEWEKKYHWHEPHKVPQVQYKVGMVEASCVKCHTGVEYIPQGEIVNKGRRNIRKYGCNACHKIEGWEHNRKPGPALSKIAAKIDKEFFKNWVWDPKAFNEHAKMPSFFNQTNNSKTEFVKKNMAEVNSMADFIFENAVSYRPFKKFTGGNEKRGKALIMEVGCMGCHGVEGMESESKKIDAFAGPFLTATGSKVNADWLISWLLKPSHYQENTIMPSFRLSIGEASDIAAYLMSLKNEKFERLKFEPLDKGIRDGLLVEYFSAFDTIDVANKKLASMSDHERSMELGKRSVGKYGCYSCHEIKGFEGRAPIGPELTKVGSKPLTQFNFSHEYDVEHSRDGWILAHLQSPRRWDNGVDKPFKDLLRMPNFHMSETDAQSITVALLGQVSEKIPLIGKKNFDKDEALVAEGMKVVTKFNCIGCHKIDGEYGDITKMFSDDENEGPPQLNGEGHRAQADWFHHFLGNVYPIRPWLKVRMPSFNLSNDEKNILVASFQAKAKQHTFEENLMEISWATGEKEAAKTMFKELNCISCHATGFINDEPSAPDLHYVKRRLRPSWVKKWLEGPAKILPYTAMPSFWEGGESQFPDLLGGDSAKQIEAMTKYLMEIGHDKYSPDGKNL